MKMGVKTAYLPPQFLATIASFESKVIRVCSVP